MWWYRLNNIFEIYFIDLLLATPVKYAPVRSSGATPVKSSTLMADKSAVLLINMNLTGQAQTDADNYSPQRHRAHRDNIFFHLFRKLLWTNEKHQPCRAKVGLIWCSFIYPATKIGGQARHKDRRASEESAKVAEVAKILLLAADNRRQSPTDIVGD